MVDERTRHATTELAKGMGSRAAQALDLLVRQAGGRIFMDFDPSARTWPDLLLAQPGPE